MNRKFRQVSIWTILVVVFVFSIPLSVWKFNEARQKLELSLVRSCFEGHLGEVRQLISRGVDENCEAPASMFYEIGNSIELPGTQWSPLQAASVRGELEVVELLLLAGADPNHDDQNGRSPLHRAILAQHDGVALALIKAGADVNKTIPSFYGIDGPIELISPLSDASCRGKTDIMQALIESGADIGPPAPSSTTPLHWAVMGNQPQAVELLVRNGANVNAQDETRSMWTPLHDAYNLETVTYPNTKSIQTIIDILINAGADNKLEDAHGISPEDRDLLRAF